MRHETGPDPFAAPFSIQIGLFQIDSDGDERGELHVLGSLPQELLIKGGLVYLITLNDRRQIVGRVGAAVIRDGQRRRPVQLKSPLFAEPIRAHLVSPQDSEISELLWLNQRPHHTPPAKGA